MINKQNQSPVIVDSGKDVKIKYRLADYTDSSLIAELGKGVKVEYYLSHYNHNYGGRNDLISLGILVYKMAAGNDLFAEAPKLIGGLIPKIETKVEEVYSDSKKLNEMFSKIKKELPGALADIIIYLMNRDLNQNLSVEIIDEAQAALESHLQNLKEQNPQHPVVNNNE
jgi:hypothetical protein